MNGQYPKSHEENESTIRMANTPPPLSFNDALMGYLAFSLSYAVISGLTFGPFILFYIFPQSTTLRTILALVVVPYYVYTLTPSLGRYYELHDGLPRPEFSQQFFVFRWMRNFLRFRMIVAPELQIAEAQSKAQFVVAEFPHAVWADYHVPMDALLHTDVFPHIASNVRSLAATVLFRAPVVREWCLWTSGVDARKSVAEAALQRGRTVIVRPGGLAEQLRTTKGREIVFLQNRKGFLVLAMKHGVPVVPCYIFGASDYHHTFGWLFGIREFIQKRFGVALPLAVGYWGSMCPRPVPTTVAFGKPILFHVTLAGHPTAEEVDHAHKQFCRALLDLFEEHKHAAGYGDRELEVM
ncbi:diacylglycerol acyltransferase [Nitzschia inconspicua]|uniref:Acyltransferase n=1 Tax=Nitzschia inconspicua TaxID=303405 RepID=A0A9K3PWC3_9STRA|nr:diacylglycerol acyltransferase [Nitzschia inconspicua]